MSGITANVATPPLPIIPFTPGLGHQRFLGTNLRVQNPSTLLSISLLAQLSQITNDKDGMIGQAAMCLMFNIFQFTPFILMSEYTVPSKARDVFYEQLRKGNPILVNENNFINFRRTKAFFSEPLIRDRGMTMEDVIRLIATKLPFAVIKHYSVSGNTNIDDIREKVRINKADKFFTTSQNLKNSISDQKKWVDQTGYLACFEIRGIWPGQSGPMIAPIVAVNGDYALIISPIKRLRSQWIPINVLHKAMSQVDTRSTLPGGLIEIYMPYP